MVRFSLFRKKSVEASAPMEQPKNKSKSLKKSSSSVVSVTSAKTSDPSICSHVEGPIKCVHKMTETSAPREIVVDRTEEYIQTVARVIKAMNDKDPVPFQACFSENAVFVPEDVDPIPIQGFLEYFINFQIPSFPDATFTYRSIKKNGNNGNSFVVDEAQFSGTHTGAPYTAMPGKLPPIPAKGDVVVNDEERWFFDFEEDGSGKIKSWSLIALGPSTGPMGAYESLKALM